MTDLERFLDFLDFSFYPKHLISESNTWRDRTDLKVFHLEFSGDRVHESMFWIFTNEGRFLFSSLGA